MSHTITRRVGYILATLACCLGLVACVSVDATNPAATGGAPASESLEDRVTSGLSIQAERGSETLDIKRAKPGATKPAKLEKDSWTVFVYLCGSDLETQNGAATKDLQEMVGASGSSNVSFVVETGGAKTWRNNAVKTRQLGRYLIQDGALLDVGSTTASSMGDPNTLANFLAWGIKNYPAEHMAVIMWDHGGGSINGVCFDERNNYDSLSLREVDAAFAAAYTQMWDKFEFVGFDACLMSTLEAANVLASYAKYMIASQESEPANGWEYSTIMEYLAKNPTTDGKALGKVICDSYLGSLDRNSKGFATLACVDLGQIDDLVQDFYRFSQEMYAAGEDQKTLAAMSRGISKVDNYGGNNWREGYSNMVDLGGIVDACASVTPSAADVKASLHKAVTYQIRGTYHAAANGLSTYYPLKIQNAKELSVFQSIAPNPSYLSYVDRLAHGATYNGGSQYTQYTNDPIFGEGGLWSWLTGTPQQVQQQVDQQAEDHWNYVDDHSDNASSSSQITFATKPQVDNEGTYWFQLDQNGIDNAAVVSGMVYETSADGKDLIALGETYDVQGDWSTGRFNDAFDGYWLSLPDGQNLCLNVVDKNSDFVIFTAPIILNGKECYLRLQQRLSDYKVSVVGAWNGVSTNGMIDRNIVSIKRGDKIVPLYNAFTPEQGVSTNSYEGEEYTVTSKGLKVDYSYLPSSSYLYNFCIEDVFGDYFLTDTVKFEIDDDGSIYF